MSTITNGYLESPTLARLWAAAREAWERNGCLSGSAVLNDLSEAEAIEITGLLGRRRPLRAHTTLRLPLAEVDEALRAFSAPLEDRLVSIGGPLVDRRQLRADAAAERLDLWNEVEARANEIRPDLHRVVTDLRRTGLARRLAGSDERRLLLQSFDVLEGVLDLNATIDIAVLAAQRCGDAKALNAGNPVGTVVLRSLALLTGVATPSDEEGRRDLWERHSVICDSLSSTVLVLNMRLQGDSALARSLAVSAGAGEPRVVTLRELARTSAGIANSSIFVCENPTVVSAAADRKVDSDVGLVCVDGWPSVAAHRLLRLAKRGGVSCAYHGDFDWHGLRIAESVIRQYRGQPWRMSAGDYLEAMASGASAKPLLGAVFEPSWDSDLGPAMAAAGKVIEEEGDVLERLLEDLAHPNPRSHEDAWSGPLTPVIRAT
jgi:uncharacterized protein (TIGR02679 family)